MFDVEPLRCCEEWLSDLDYAKHICNQALAEIERLREELAERVAEIGKLNIALRDAQQIVKHLDSIQNPWDVIRPKYK